MAKVSLAEHMREHPKEADHQKDVQNAGPFLTLSRQYGCWGFSLGLLLMEVLNEDPADPEHTWRIYNREILSRLATETNMAVEFLEQERRTKPRLLDFFRAFSKDRGPSGYEIRNRIQALIRGLAVKGYAIVIGQGGAGATSDLPNGLSIRLEAPLDWRVKEIAFREGLSETEARLRVRARDRERAYLEKVYALRFPRKPPFHITYDCSIFTLAQIATHTVQAMKMRGII